MASAVKPMERCSRSCFQSCVAGTPEAKEKSPVPAAQVKHQKAFLSTRKSEIQAATMISAAVRG
jgi:hypothetical protein